PPPPSSFPPDWVMNIPALLGVVQAGQVAVAASVTRGQVALTEIAAGMALYTALASVAAGVGIGAVPVEAAAGHFHEHLPAAPAGGTPSFGFVYVPAGAPAQLIRLRDPRSGAVDLVQLHGNGLLVYRSELVAETSGKEHTAVMLGRMSPQGA